MFVLLEYVVFNFLHIDKVDSLYHRVLTSSSEVWRARRTGRALEEFNLTRKLEAK